MTSPNNKPKQLIPRDSLQLGSFFNHVKINTWIKAENAIVLIFRDFKAIINNLIYSN